jgi:hypothetical protein
VAPGPAGTILDEVAPRLPTLLLKEAGWCGATWPPSVSSGSFGPTGGWAAPIGEAVRRTTAGRQTGARMLGRPRHHPCPRPGSRTRAGGMSRCAPLLRGLRSLDRGGQMAGSCWTGFWSTPPTRRPPFDPWRTASPSALCIVAVAATIRLGGRRSACDRCSRWTATDPGCGREPRRRPVAGRALSARLGRYGDDSPMPAHGTIGPLQHGRGRSSMGAKTARRCQDRT